MSLTLLIHDKHPVAIVRWFLDSKGNVVFACGPVVQMPLEEFRATGYDWVRRHFEEYRKIRVPEEKVVQVFQPGEAAKLMKDRSALEIGRDPSGNLVFLPKAIRKYDLAYLEGLGREARRSISENSPPNVFWKTFDEVLAIAREAERA